MELEINALEDMDCVARYAEILKRNVEDNKVMLKKLKLDAVKAPRPAVAPMVKKRKSPKKRPSDDFVIRRNPARSTRVAPARFDLPYSRARSGSVSSTVSSSSSSLSAPEKLVVRFGFFKGRPSTASSDNLDDDLENDEHDMDDDDDECPLPQIRRKARTCHEFLAPEDVTQAHLDAVAVLVSDKKYDSINGTSCHQCRQKTDDMKTMCRSSTCLGVRGQFCGPCLRNRYGEDAKVALKDPEWECPPCRGICNCSFCRKKKGRACTGILVHVARSKGFSDVCSYLESLQKA